MKIIYFFHCVLDQNIERITNTINVYFSRTNYSFFVNDHFSFYAYKRQGLRFFWRVNPIELNFEDMGLQSEVVLKGQMVGKKEITEIRISFTDDPILEHYFEGLVYYLLEHFEIIDGSRHIPCLKGKLKFTSLYEYNLYKMKRDRDSQEDLDRAFPGSINELEGLPYERNGEDEAVKAESIEVSEDNHHETSNDKQSGQNQLPVDISLLELDKYQCLKDVKLMSRYYKSYHYQDMRLIILKIPGAHKEWQLSGKGRWGPGWIKMEITADTISRYLHGLYDLGVRTINHCPIPHKPIKTKTGLSGLSS